MKPLTLVTHHYNGHNQVEELFSSLAKFSPSIRQQLEIIVVDDHSEITKPLPITEIASSQFRVLNDIPWNQPGARNLGIFMCKTPWSLLFDIDQHPKEEGLEYVLKNLESLDPRTTYCFRVDNYFDANDNCALDVHPNTLLVSTQHFKEFGMYDEDFSGNYAHEDLYLAVMLEQHGGRRLVLGKSAFFQDVGHKTERLVRDLEPNRRLAHTKILNGSPTPNNFIRFKWERVANNGK
jgi:hypothetical protein